MYNCVYIYYTDGVADRHVYTFMYIDRFHLEGKLNKEKRGYHIYCIVYSYNM